MHPGLHRAAKRRSAPSLPKRRAGSAPARNLFQRESSGFEGLIPAGGSEDFFFSGFISDPEEAAEILEHGEGRETFDSNPRLGVTVSAGFHIFIVLFLLFEPALELLGARDDREEAAAERNPLVVFMEEPQPEAPPVVVVPLVPVPEAQPTPPAEKPPQVADDRMLIPKAMLPSPKPQDFMNDLPFSEGKTDEFYTDEEVKDPGKEGETEKPEEPKDEPVMAAESGADAQTAEESAGSDSGNGGVEKPEMRLDPGEVAELIFGDARAREAARARVDIRPPEPKPLPRELGEGGEDGAFTDIRRFLAGARFENPEGGLVSNTENSLYYNDKGANFVPWIRRMLAEVRRNWLVPYSVAFNHGHVAVGISVARDGTVTELKVLIPSGISGFDNAGVGALRASILLPLPADYPDDKFDIILVFWYNERPYDLFG
jgi:outer membrane biosynthesis protein TonB